MNIKGIIYNETTGEIIRTVSCPLHELHMQEQDGEDSMLVDEYLPDELFFVFEGQVVPRPPMPITVNGNVLSDVPVGAELRIDNAIYPVTSNTVELEFPVPGVYRVELKMFPYLPFQLEVTQ